MAESAAETLYQEAQALAAQIIERARDRRGIDDLPLRDVVARLEAHLHSGQELLAFVAEVSDNHMLARHTVNTCLLTLTIGQGLGLPDEEIEPLGMCALLYDVGLAQLLRDRPPAHGGSSDVFDDLKRHTELGVECLRAMQVQIARAYRVAAEHHERYDGSGYPRQLMGGHIDFWAQIVGLADLYETFTHPRAHREHSQPQAHFFLRQLITQEGLFDPQIIKVLLNQISLYPIGTWVKLNTGAIGRVYDVNPGVPLRPKVELHFEHGQPVHPPRRMNLKDVPVFFIRGITTPREEGIPLP